MVWSRAKAMKMPVNAGDVWKMESLAFGECSDMEVEERRRGRGKPWFLAYVTGWMGGWMDGIMKPR